MTLRTESYPDPARSGIGVVLFSTWKVATPAAQQAAVEAIAAVWQREPWPSDGLLGYYVYAGQDGETLLHYSQWTGEDAYEAYVRSHRRTRVDEIDAAVDRAGSGVERVGPGRYRHYRGRVGEGDPRVPGCIVTVDVEFEGPDPERQRAWVDTVFEALDDDPAPHPGSISAHFHVSTDGTRVFNYAEWESEQAHIDALAAPGDGIGSPTPLWRRVWEFPGRRQSTVRRYRLACGLTPG